MSLLKNWSTDEYNTLEKGVILAEHGLGDTGLFTDESLAQLIDNHPEEQLTIATMGNDPTKFDWLEGEKNNATGEQILELAKAGRLWLSLRKVLDFQPQIAEKVNGIYCQLEANAPHFKAQERTANLLISSSTAMVPYHVDMPVNMLWHIRGKKRVWVYPHFDYRFVARSVVEKVCAGELSEDVPYDPFFDNFALTFDVEPGQLLTWPQLSPHRVQNLGGLCVSLSTEHKNPRARRRISMHEANHVLRRQFGMFYRGAEVDSATAYAKQAFMKIYRTLRKEEKEQFVYSKTFAIDATHPDGIVMLDRENVLPAELRESDDRS